jgi:Flp pilus assembly protein TadD
VGSSFYEEKGLGAHASSLTALGHPDEAAALRSQALVRSTLTRQAELMVWLGLADDHHAGGDLDLAWDAAQQALALFPRSPQVHALLADIAFAAGYDDDSDFHLWMSALNGITQRAGLGEAERFLDLGDVLGARAVFETLGKRRAARTTLRVRHARLLVLEDEPMEALAVLEGQRVKNLDHPEVLAVRGWAQTRTGDRAAASKTLEWARVLYPHHGWVRNASEIYGASAP